MGVLAGQRDECLGQRVRRVRGLPRVRDVNVERPLKGDLFGVEGQAGKRVLEVLDDGHIPGQAAQAHVRMRPRCSERPNSLATCPLCGPPPQKRHSRGVLPVLRVRQHPEVLPQLGVALERLVHQPCAAKHAHACSDVLDMPHALVWPD